MCLRVALIILFFYVNFEGYFLFILDLLRNDIWPIYSEANVSVIVIALSLFFLIFLAGLSSLAASYLNPVRSFVPQMPKLLKSLFPIRDEKRGKQPSPLAHQVKARRKQQ